jgi:hypothetical protein
MQACTWLVFTGLVMTSFAATASGASDDLLAMARTLAGAQRFGVTLHMRYDAVQASGQKVEFAEVRKVRLDRPGRVRVDTVQSDGDESRLVFDGKTLTLYSGRENVYSQSEHAGDVDSVVRFAVRELGVRVPLARLLVSTLPDEIERLSREVVLVERSRLDGELTDHLAGRTPDVDYQIWLGEDTLPRRIVLTYRHEPGQPQFRADFSDWNFAPAVSDAIFAFNAPEGAERIPTLLPRGRAAGQGDQ